MERGEILMKRSNRLIAGLMVLSVLVSMCSCSGTTGSGRIYSDEESKPERRASGQPDPKDPGLIPTPSTAPDDGITDLTMFTTIPGVEKSDNNDIKELIAQKTGVRVNETWLTGMTENEAIDMIIASGELPDYIYAVDSSEMLYQYDLLVPWDEYIEKYPNIRELYTDAEWNQFRMDDGHIYWADVFNHYYKQDMTTVHNGQAFWIQVRVLEWAGYPEIRTLDEYFDLLERYSEANPTMPDGNSVIPYTCLCEDWRYYSIESVPMYLDGYPNNGCVIVDVEEGKDKPIVVDYNTTDTAKMYYGKLNEEYQKGIIDPDFAVQTYDEYISKLCTGRVLGMSDCYWDFGYFVKDAFALQLYAEDGTPFRLDELGCEYVPLGLTTEPWMDQQWHTYGSGINTSSGIAVTVNCADPDLAFSFLDDLLSQEIHDLRFWGVKDVDYRVDDNGLFYRTEEMRNNWKNSSYRYDHTCEYSYMPQWKGMSHDGKNCMVPEEQPYEYRASLSKPVSRCFDAYNVNSYVELIGSAYCEQLPWYPLYTWSNNLTTSTPAGRAWSKIGECKHEWIPKLIIGSDFDGMWNDYLEVYKACDPDVFLTEAQAEVDARLKTAKENGWTT